MASAERTSAPAPAPAETPAAASDSPAALPAAAADAIRSPGAGSPLPASVERPLSSSFGADLGPVRVHTDTRATGAADAIGARAFAWGSHVFLGRGEQATDVPLVAHEVAHVLQQQGAGPAVRLFSPASAAPLEREAHAASAAAVRGERAAIGGRTGGPRIQRWPQWIERAGSAIASGARAVGGAVASAASAVASVGSGVVQAALNWVKDHARQIPGYDLLSFILGRDPITQQPVPRTAMNLIRAVVSLIPGAGALLQQLEESGAIERAGAWFGTEVGKLGFTWEMIRGLFSRAWDALGVADLINPAGAWAKLRDIFGPPLARLRDFAVAAGRKLLEIMFEAVLARLGGQRILNIFRRAQAAFTMIVNDPVGFLRNLINAVKGGFQRFVGNLLDHLRTGLFEWLMGALQGAIRLPQRWNLMGILDVVLQVLGLTWERMRERLVRLIGAPAVQFIETAFDWLRTIVTGGLAAAWEKILEFASGLVDTVIEAIKGWVMRSVVGAAVTRLLTMFNPIGAVIQAIIGAYNTVMFFIERAQQIAALVESIVDSISSIASGNLGSAIASVERTLARTLPVIISFLARFIGLGNIAGTIRGIIDRIRGTVDRAIDRVLNWIVERVRGLIARFTGRERPDAAAGAEEARVTQQVQLADEPHTITVRLTPGGVAFGMASDHVDEMVTKIRERIPVILNRYRTHFRRLGMITEFDRLSAKFREFEGGLDREERRIRQEANAAPREQRATKIAEGALRIAQKFQEITNEFGIPTWYVERNTAINHDENWQRTTRTVHDAIDHAFARVHEFSGIERSDPGWSGRDYGSGINSAWHHPSGAEVSVDYAHRPRDPLKPWDTAPDQAHVGWYAPGTRLRLRTTPTVGGHILLDYVPWGRPRGTAD